MKNWFCYENTKEIISAKKIVPLDDYVLQVCFSNGETRFFDAKPLFNDNIYAPLKSRMLFDEVYIRCGSAAWNDDLDICPESLYWDSIPEKHLTK